MSNHARYKKLLLERFPNDSRLYSPGDKLMFLIDMAYEFEYRHIKTTKRLASRAKFDKMKTARQYTRCWVCMAKAQCFHHMHPITHGGSYRWYNVVELCNSCHSRIHPWLQAKNRPL